MRFHDQYDLNLKSILSCVTANFASEASQLIGAFRQSPPWKGASVVFPDQFDLLKSANRQPRMETRLRATDQLKHSSSRLGQAGFVRIQGVLELWNLRTDTQLEGWSLLLVPEDPQIVCPSFFLR